jgi:mitochondrial fission protein ELM1
MDLPTRWLSAARMNAVTVMLGGDNRRYAITPEMTGHMGEQLALLARTTRSKLMLIPSRRTPGGLIDSITAALPDGSVLTPAEDEPNVYPGVLGLGQAVIVTSDSVNMASEAAITGKPVLVIGWKPPAKDSPTGESGRIASFHKNMVAGGHTAIFDGSIPSGNFVRLDEMADMTTRLLTLLGR